MNTPERSVLGALLSVALLACESNAPPDPAQADAAGGAPVGGAPAPDGGGLGGMPVGGTPVGGTPVGGTPVGGTAMTTDAGVDAAVVDAAPVEPACITDRMWTGGNRESPLMHPGGECIDCHTRLDGPPFDIAGTVYAGFHQVLDCNGESGATVVITDANGQVFTLTSNSAGNFYLPVGRGLQTPYTAKVVVDGVERVMFSPQTNGDCNSCHTQDGANGAPGRVHIP